MEQPYLLLAYTLSILSGSRQLLTVSPYSLHLLIVPSTFTSHYTTAEKQSIRAISTFTLVALSNDRHAIFMFKETAAKPDLVTLSARN